MQADAELLRDLFASSKDRHENRLIGEYIEDALSELANEGLIDWTKSQEELNENNFFVRRLLHLQHICQRYEAELSATSDSVNITRHLLRRLHPTPAVCGVPLEASLQFIRDYETVGFDRGYYAGPIGYIGRTSTDILVAIRSGLVVPGEHNTQIFNYAGAGLVKGSTLKGEWSETNYKLGVISSIFPQSPITLQGAPNPNTAWATAFIEELIRNGVTRFYVCPGSRSTPLVVAIARAARAYVGVVKAVSVHDERAAGFRAVGYGRGANRPAAVVTSSGTAVANLYPAIVEAGQDGVPMLVLTADRPYENRDTGANQAIDQVKVFSSSYIRWFRDILPPSDDVPVSVALSDAGHAVSLTKVMRGPVHMNMQFRENLAPEAGPIRGDARVASLTDFNGFRFTDVAGFKRWALTGNKFTSVMPALDRALSLKTASEVASFIEKSRSGIIVVGSLRGPTEGPSEEHNQMLSEIAEFALMAGMPVFAGVQAASLRFSSEAVIPFAELLLKSPLVSSGMAPDLIIQIGASLLSSEVSNVILKAMESDTIEGKHILIHPRAQHERVDPDFTVTHTISCDVSAFLRTTSELLNPDNCGSDLTTLLHLGRALRAEMPEIIHNASNELMLAGSPVSLTEPQVVLAVAKSLSNSTHESRALFLSNSMPVRDAEFFLYPTAEDAYVDSSKVLKQIGTNRGASGIDGILSSTLGFSESVKVPTTLLVGDVATLHDLTSMHSMANDIPGSKQLPGDKPRPVVTVIVNNNGGGIFSFLPIAQHGSDAAFNDFFATPTDSFSFSSGAAAFGLECQSVDDFATFTRAYELATSCDAHRIVEARVVPHEANVAVHRSISEKTVQIVKQFLKPCMSPSERLPVKVYERNDLKNDREGGNPGKTLVLLHGWMGDMTDWDNVALKLEDELSHDWTIISVDLPGHGEAPHRRSSEWASARKALGLDDDDDSWKQRLNVDALAYTVLHSLKLHHNIHHIDAIAGYSLGGRVALAMKKLSDNPQVGDVPILSHESKMILISANPGNLSAGSYSEDDARLDWEKLLSDDKLARRVACIASKSSLQRSQAQALLSIERLLLHWYAAPMWGQLEVEVLNELVTKRAKTLIQRGRDLATVLSECSPPRNSREMWKHSDPAKTLFISGDLDLKYTKIGNEWKKQQSVKHVVVPNAGHNVLIQAPFEVVDTVVEFLHSKERYQNRVAVPTPVLIKGKPAPTLRIAALEVERGVVSGEKEGNIMLTRPLSSDCIVCVRSVEIVRFVSPLHENSLTGIGWEDGASCSNSAGSRLGMILQMTSDTGSEVGLGEVSPLAGLHKESFDDAFDQLLAISDSVNQGSFDFFSFDAESVLLLQGGLAEVLNATATKAGIGDLLPSVRSGLEMALLGLASQRMNLPLHQALADNTKLRERAPKLGINGLMLRRSRMIEGGRSEGTRLFPSTKVKVGHREHTNDHTSVSRAFQLSEKSIGREGCKVRFDANRAWNESQAIEFATALDGMDINAISKIEFIEEPLQAQVDQNKLWSLSNQIVALERSYLHTAIPYALDESLSDLASACEFDFDAMKAALDNEFFRDRKGCQAFVLKPTILGLELSARLGKLAREKYGIAAIFSSAFDTGLSLSFTALLAFTVDGIVSETPTFPHGLGTFEFLERDLISPTFESYVDMSGYLAIAPLSRALYGLSLDDLRIRSHRPVAAVKSRSPLVRAEDDDEGSYSSTAMTIPDGEINVVVSLPLPFSADIACARFTDLPQQPRWSPWISSVSYQGDETEWVVKVRGISLKWRAMSELVHEPWPGIRWESVAGLVNRGLVEFIPDTENTSHMNVRMTLTPPRILSPLFQGTSVFIEDFLRDKLLKWSLEMFRDTVKADLALERGDVELGDALIGAVEGKASAIEATLNTPPNIPPTLNGGDKSEDYL